MPDIDTEDVELGYGAGWDTALKDAAVLLSTIKEYFGDALGRCDSITPVIDDTEAGFSFVWLKCKNRETGRFILIGPFETDEVGEVEHETV